MSPLKSRTKVLGALTFVTAESGRIYDTHDLRAAGDLAHRAVVAIENASLLAALKESDRRKDEFLAMLAHELRNPLAPIRNAVQILRVKGSALPELQWARDVIDRQVQQMTRLVDDLLDVSRITRGKIELRKEQVELAAVVSSAVEASRPLIEKWGHELTVTIPEEPIHLEADLTRLSQVLSNLLNNAAKYTDQGGRIWLTAERQSDQVLDPSEGHRHWDPHRNAAPHLRDVQASGPFLGALRGRAWHRTDAGPAVSGNARRHRGSSQPGTWQRQRVCLAAAASFGG